MKTVSTTITDDDFAGLRLICKQFGKSRAEVIRAGIALIIADNGEAEFMFEEDGHW